VLIIVERKFARVQPGFSLTFSNFTANVYHFTPVFLAERSRAIPKMAVTLIYLATAGISALSLGRYPLVHSTLLRPRAASPRLQNSPISTKLLAADVTLIFAFSFSRTLTKVLLDPAFPGWLAPIRADSVRLSDTLNFASSWAVAWILAALTTGAFAMGAGDAERVGTRGALVTFSAAAVLWFGIALVQGSLASETPLPLPALSVSIDTGEAALGIAASMMTWRWALVGE
jgi:hypothetical protein